MPSKSCRDDKAFEPPTSCILETKEIDSFASFFFFHESFFYKRYIPGPGHLRGEDTHLSKLTEDKVKEIRRRAALGESFYDIAEEFNMSDVSIRDVAKGLTWKHVEEGKDCMVIRGPKSMPRGEESGNAKLTEDKVREIRKRSAVGDSYVTLSRAYNIGISAITSVVKRRNWKHVSDEEVTV